MCSRTTCARSSGDIASSSSAVTSPDASATSPDYRDQAGRATNGSGADPLVALRGDSHPCRPSWSRRLVDMKTAGVTARGDLLTAEDLAVLLDEGSRLELIQGVLQTMPRAGFDTGSSRPRSPLASTASSAIVALDG